MFFIGIDPGLRGGISGLDLSNQILWSVEMPVITIESKKAKKLEYDITRIAALLRACRPDRICLEHVHSMPGQGVSSTFLFGKGFGILLGVIGALGFTCDLVTPRVWKHKLTITADKNTSRAKADEVFPTCTPFWKLKKHDGLAESALLAYYGAGLPDLDLIKPGDISKLYNIQENHSGKNRNPRRHHNNTSNPKNGSSRDRKNQRLHSGTSRSSTVGT